MAISLLSAAAQTNAASRAGSLALVGGALALDFANTASARGWDTHCDHLGSAQDVLTWAAHAGALPPDETSALRGLVADDAQLGVRLLWRALALREDIYRIGRELAARRPAPEEALGHVAATHAQCLAAARFRPGADGFGWSWSARRAPVEATLGPIALSAVAMLESRDLSRLKQCRGEKCGWLFLDTTRNGRRCWCEMEICGNRAKQRRFAARARGA